jgi:hypothetical protein
LLFEVAHAAGLTADARLERLLGGRLFRPRLRETVVDGDDFAFRRALDCVEARCPIGSFSSFNSRISVPSISGD